jgi:hypothetical protein
MGFQPEARLLQPAESEPQTCRPYRLRRIQTVLHLKIENTEAAVD